MIGIQIKRGCRMTQKKEQEILKITDGPSELDLIYALMRGETVIFTVDGCKVPVIIYCLEVPEIEGMKQLASDSSRKIWSFKGRFKMLNGPNRDRFLMHRFHGVFSYADHRQGELVIDK